MKLEHYNEKKLKSDIKKIFKEQKVASSFKVFFFGSRVLGTSLERSDIDLGVYGIKKLNIEKKIIIEEKINNLPLLYKFDFVDFFDVSKDFKREALKKVEYIIN